MSEKQIITCEVCGETYEYEVKGDGSPHPYQDELMGYCGAGADPVRSSKSRVRPLNVRRRNRTKADGEG